MAPLTRRAGLGLVVCAAVWAAVAIAVGVHKGGDFPPEMAQSDRLLLGSPLYDRNPPLGVWWPPFTAAAFVPFALVARWSYPLALTLWATLGAGCVIWSVHAAARRWGWTPALLGFVAVAAPIQNSFEHLQITTVLLALVVAAAIDLEASRDTRAGVWLGTATAAKAFPALLLVYLAYRRHWRAFLVGGVVTGALTLGAMLPYGPRGAVAAVWDWLQLNMRATGVGGLHMQKLARLGYGLGAPLGIIIMAELALVAAVTIVLHRRREPADPWSDIGMVTIVAVLISPVGWYYYFGLLFPAWVAVLRPLGRVPWSRTRYAVLGIAALLLSGLPTRFALPAPLAFLLSHGDTKGSLLLLGALALQRFASPNPDSDRS